ncbi:unnamed protein product [Schistosoma mattheei]|uniref:Uncharacterized protein n=1 Tax=Schistosoma mattheei TaxID=31246 RepID=A0A183Q0A4_9TREM|nr:unnamed protein product [Schistosoma mattheei]
MGVYLDMICAMEAEVTTHSNYTPTSFIEDHSDNCIKLNQIIHENSFIEKPFEIASSIRMTPTTPSATTTHTTTPTETTALLPVTTTSTTTTTTTMTKTNTSSNYENIYIPTINNWNQQMHHSRMDKSHFIDYYKTNYLLNNSSHNNNHKNKEILFIFENGKSMSYRELLKSGFGNWANQIKQFSTQLKLLIQDDYNAIWGLAALILVNYKSINCKFFSFFVFLFCFCLANVYC